MKFNIEAERVRAGLTQVEVAKILKISPKTYSNYIKDSPIPSDVLIRMSDLFNCSIDYLLGIERKSA